MRSQSPKFLALAICAALCVQSPLFAQEGDGLAPASGGESSFTTGGEVTSGDSLGEDVPGFFFQGGYGFLPEMVSALGGVDVRPPIDFSFTLEQGYIDNIYNVPRGHPYRKGSFVTRATLGTSLLFSRERLFLSLSARAGAEYYWEKFNEPFSPTGELTLAIAYRATPRLSLTARINGGYFTQPDFSTPNLPNRVNAGDYFRLGSHFDLDYRWAERFSTTTSFGISTLLYKETYSQDSNYVMINAGQAFRYILSPLSSAVLDLRYSEAFYDDSVRGSRSQYLLGGLDWRWTSKLSLTLRGGVEFRQFELAGADDAVSPYFEGTLGYRYGRGSFVQWVNRFGLEESYDRAQKNQSFRTGVQVTQIITPRINARLGGSYSYQELEGLAYQHYRQNQHLLTGNIGFDFVYNRSLSFFTNYSIFGVLYDGNSGSNYSRNEIFIGATYRF